MCIRDSIETANIKDVNHPVNSVFGCIENKAATKEPTNGAKSAMYIYFSMLILSSQQYHLS